jgi:hypothetical protein
MKSAVRELGGSPFVIRFDVPVLWLSRLVVVLVLRRRLAVDNEDEDEDEDEHHWLKV